ncbi:MAG: hypothetical protein F6K54_15525 [Okeania sp. SIO3B5]|uniref:hypothetical protein n=1 Tax=Okeania sp. SIO3B5 TaxID=2607811 RepID=UPI00140007C9|nr:hypothetical protein [Okeania sp. SIO3B5]NEO54367.1 hypothetical protein [Okeania sp. SIO3B5]
MTDDDKDGEGLPFYKLTHCSVVRWPSLREATSTAPAEPIAESVGCSRGTIPRG